MLEICPMTLKEANSYVEQYHRHHRPVVGHKFSIGLSDGEKIVGVAIVGRPVSRHLDDGWTLEVNRLCTGRTNQVTTQVKLNGSGKMVSRDGATGTVQMVVAPLGAVDSAVCVTIVRIIRMDDRVSGR